MKAPYDWRVYDLLTRLNDYLDGELNGYRHNEQDGKALLKASRKLTREALHRHIKGAKRD